jgi:hypothetical protein
MFVLASPPLRTRHATGRSELRTRLVIVLAAALLGAAACDYTRPFEDTCVARLKATELRVVAEPIIYTTDYSLSGADLTLNADPGAGRVVHGLTRTNLRSSVVLRGTGVTHPVTHRHCLRPNIEVSLAFTPMTVYISRDLPPGSCEFSSTTRHELQHVATYRAFLDSITPAIEKELLDYFGNRIFYYASESDAQTGMNREANDRIGPYIEESMKQVQARQALLDTREEYDRLERSCGH